MIGDGADGALAAALDGLRTAMASLALPLAVWGVGEARAERSALLAQLDDYLLPRVHQLDAPLLAVVGGSTGAGKSTLVNSVIGQVVSPAGVLRPTTRSPVLVHHRLDAAWFVGDRVLPTFARVTGSGGDDAGGERAVRLVPNDALPQRLALLDAPDIDSVVAHNRELAGQLMAAADLWLFVTTAARYADAVPWDALQRAVSRGTSVAVVLNRVPLPAMQEVRTDLAGLLRAQGLAGAPLFTIPETPTDAGLLPRETVAPLERWLRSLAADAAVRQTVVKRTLTGALDALAVRVPHVVAAGQAQADALAELEASAMAAYRTAGDAVSAGVSDGSLLRGEVLARWQDFVGTGRFFRQVESAVGRLRDRLTSALRGGPSPEEPLGEALQTGAQALLRAQCEWAAAQVALHWRAAPAGAALIDAPGETVTRLDRPGPDLPARTERLVRDWQAGVLDLVRTEGAGRRLSARLLSFGVNGVGVVLMLVAFSQTGGLVGAEVGVAAGTAAVAQRLLEAVFGDQAVRSLAAKARKDLLRRVATLMDVEKARYLDLLAAQGVDRSRADALQAAADAVQGAR